ncbi:MAG: proprotein convertase P-domain-containing protein [Saprospiraceae bacterium]
MDFANSCSDTPPAISGTFQPVNPFSTFIGENASGIWTLSITDNANADGGLLQS